MQKMKMTKSLRFKFFVAFFSIAALFLVELGINSYFDKQHQQAIHEVIEAEQFMVFLNQKIVDHYDFVNKVSLMINDSSKKFKPVDYTACSLGKWYYDYTPESRNKEVFERLEAPHIVLHNTSHEISELIGKGNTRDAEKLFMTVVVPTVEEIKGLLNEFSNIEAKYTKEIEDNMEELEKKISLVKTSVALLAFVIAIFVSFILARKIVKPIEEIVSVMSEVSSGNLRVSMDYTSEDELGLLSTAVNDMINKLSEIIRGINEKTDVVVSNSNVIKNSLHEINIASDEITKTIVQVATNSDSIAKDLGDILGNSSNLEKMGAGLDEIVERTVEAVDKSSKASQIGQTVVKESVKSLHEVRNTVDFATSAIEKLRDRSGEIGAMVKVIESISSQTNLLALNASIESARAGEAGKGFAVVAEEIRKLAEDSSDAASQIVSLIENIESETTATVNSMEFNQTQVVNQVQSIKRAEDALDEIVNQNDITSSISDELRQMALKIKEGTTVITRAVVDSNDAVQNNAASTEEVTAATEEQNATIATVNDLNDDLVTEVKALNELISGFKI